MILAFKKSCIIAICGGLALGLIAGAGVWLIFGSSISGMVNRLLVTGLAAFVGVNIAIYAARLVAQRRYQDCLLWLYERLDPMRFISELQPLLQTRLDACSRCTMLVHLSNGYQYAGQVDEALALLEQVNAPQKALELRGLVLCNKATCYLAQENADRMQATMDELKSLICINECKKEFSLKARHTLGYMQICLNILRGKNVDAAPLEKDFASSRAPLHRADVQYRLALIYRKQKDISAFERTRNYVIEQGNGLFIKQLAQELCITK